MQFKQIKTTFVQTFILALSMSSSVFAEDVTVIGSIKQTLKQSSVTPAARFSVTSKETKDKVIQLMRVKLSDEAKNHLAAQAPKALAQPEQKPLASSLKAAAPATAFPPSVQLDMNNVPVLDQGVHGTCVTFAITGGLDAVLGKGDYISQVCQLQLGNYLEKHGYGSSGWEGSYALEVINQIEQFGIINKEKEQTIGCGGYTQYPAYSSRNPELFIEPEPYRAMSELIFGNQVNWFDVFQKDNPEQTLNEVKQSLSAGNRLVFAVLLPRTDLGLAGALAKHKSSILPDTWVLTSEVISGLYNIEAAHEMIITGYDDNAIATDNRGRKHRGLLKVRNSWGSAVGDKGEFYISYAYFKLLAFDVTRIDPAH